MRFSSIKQRRLGLIAAVGLLTVSLVGCGGGHDGSATVDLVAYSTPQQAYQQQLEPAFNETRAGEGVEFTNSFGASGDQSRSVDSGQQADFVNFALESDVTRLVKSGRVSPDWRKNKSKGILTNSVVAIVTRPGNPKRIESFEDIVKDPDIEVVTPNPFTSGGARWNIMAIYGAGLAAGKSKQEALADVKAVLSKTPSQPESARVAMQAFLGGSGDVLLSYENEAIAAQQAGEDIEYVVPNATILIEQPAAVIEGADQAADDFLSFLWSDEGQTIWQQQGYRPVNRSLLDKQRFPVPEHLFTIAEFGGWDSVTKEFFEEGSGSIFKIVQDLGISTE